MVHMLTLPYSTLIIDFCVFLILITEYIGSRGFVLTAAALGLSPSLGPFAACHPPLSQPVFCHI